MNEEDEAFNDIERQAKQRKESVRAAINKDKPMNEEIQPAFPTGNIKEGTYGMTLRDYFAAKAMQACITSWIAKNIYPETDLIVAEHAYVIADAMLKAREA